MDKTRGPVTRRRFVGIASAIGTLPVVGGLPRAAAATPARQEAGGEAFPNGINATDYVGGDGSYQKYLDDGLRLGLITELYPVNFTDPETGDRTGWNTDIVLRALEHTGITDVEFVDGIWESMVPRTPSGRFDLLASDVHVTPERIEIIDFSAPAFWYGDALFVPTGNPANIHSWEDLAGKTVGVGLGTNYAEWLQKRTDLGTLNTYKDTAQMAADLMAGRVDAGYRRRHELHGLPRSKPGPPDRECSRLRAAIRILADWTRFGIRKGENDFNNVFSRALIEMLINGETLEILTNYGLGIRNLAAIPGM